MQLPAPPETGANATPQPIGRDERQRLLRQRGVVVWLTGLSGAGKTSLAQEVERRLNAMGRLTFVLDGDLVRRGLCADLGFSEQARTENIRRVCEVASMFVQAGVITLAAFISPKRADRDACRARFAPEDFIELHCRCPLSVCESRDVKGLYRQARSGQIGNFTGISAPYEAPQAPDLVVDTDVLDLDASASLVIEFLRGRGVLAAG
jgi:adenylylsulfate kinase